MRYQNDPSRAKILRDLLLNYQTEYRQAEDAPMPPDGVLDNEDDERAFYQRWEMNPRSQEFIPEGNYPNAEDGRPDAAMAPTGPADFELMEYLKSRMPAAKDMVQPIPPGPGGGRPRMLADRLRRG